MNYADFLASKHVTVEPAGFTVAPDDIHPKLFPFQRDIVRWAIGLGRAAIFENVGLGKTFQQLEWARLVAAHTGKPVLILAPLGVTGQTVREGAKINIEVKRAFTQADVGDATIVITNYDRVHHFDPAAFGGVVLDESSILKHYSKTFFKLAEMFADTPYRLCCTATPAPNDWVELGNHAMFLGVMHFKDMLARWFVGEGDIARSARLKQYARADFWRWLTSWAVCIANPADLGEQYAMPGFDLPGLYVYEHRLPAAQATIERAQANGRLFADTQPSATKFQKVKRESLEHRVEKTCEIFAEIPDDEPVIIWCDTDFEADALKEAFPDAIEVRGSQTVKRKEAGLMAFTDGERRVIISKPQLAGFGLNWQHCRNMIFAGVSFSFERTYQALGRVHRYGQTQDVHAHMIYSEAEGNVMQLLKAKQDAFREMQDEMSAAIREHGLFRDPSAPVFSSSVGNEPMVLPAWLKSYTAA